MLENKEEKSTEKTDEAVAAIIALNRVVQNRGVRGGRTLRGGFCPFNVGGFLVHWMAENRTGGGLFNEKARG